MKKKLLSMLVVTAVATTILTGCGKKNDANRWYGSRPRPMNIWRVIL